MRMGTLNSTLPTATVTTGRLARVVRVGRTSLTVEVEVYKERFGEGNGRVLATQGVLTYVAVNEKGEPVPVEAHAGTD